LVVFHLNESIATRPSCKLVSPKSVITFSVAKKQNYIAIPHILDTIQLEYIATSITKNRLKLLYGTYKRISIFNPSSIQNNTLHVRSRIILHKLCGEVRCDEKSTTHSTFFVCFSLGHTDQLVLLQNIYIVLKPFKTLLVKTFLKYN